MSYDFAISFAAPERPIAEAIALAVRNAGFRVFYDAFESVELWGEDLTVALPKRYKSARFAAALISESYLKRMWTVLERQVILETFLELGGAGYFLPIFVGEVEASLPGLSKVVGYRRIKDATEAEELAKAIISKLG